MFSGRTAAKPQHSERSKDRSGEISRNVSAARSSDVARMRASPLSVSWYICGSIFWAAQRSAAQWTCPGHRSAETSSCAELQRRVAVLHGALQRTRARPESIVAAARALLGKIVKEPTTTKILRCGIVYWPHPGNTCSARCSAAPVEHSLTRAGKSCFSHRRLPAGMGRSIGPASSFSCRQRDRLRE